MIPVEHAGSGDILGGTFTAKRWVSIWYGVWHVFMALSFGPQDCGAGMLFLLFVGLMVGMSLAACVNTSWQ